MGQSVSNGYGQGDLDYTLTNNNNTKTMSLSTKTLQLLAKTLAPTIAEKIMQSEEFADFLHTMIPVQVDEELGECEDDLHFDLSMCVMDRIILTAID